jgi:hypothetical protein
MTPEEPTNRDHRGLFKKGNRISAGRMVNHASICRPSSDVEKKWVERLRGRLSHAGITPFKRRDAIARRCLTAYRVCALADTLHSAGELEKWMLMLDAVERATKRLDDAETLIATGQVNRRGKPRKERDHIADLVARQAKAEARRLETEDEARRELDEDEDAG